MTLKKDGTPRKKNDIRQDRGLPRSKTSVLGLMRNMKAGESFYTDKEDKTVTAQASHQNIKVLTTRCLLIEDIHAPIPITRRITKVTII